MLGTVIRQIREEKLISIKDLALTCKVHPSHISKIEKNKRIPSLDLLDKIAEKLEVAVSYITLLTEISNAEFDNSVVNSDKYVDQLKNVAGLINYLLGFNRN